MLLVRGDLVRVGQETVVPFRELTPHQQMFATRIAETRAAPSRGYGLPAAGAARRLWCRGGALSDGGAHDAVFGDVTPSDVDESLSADPEPLWRVSERLEPRFRDEPFPPPMVASRLSNADRFRMILFSVSRTFNRGFAPNDDEATALLKSLEPTSELVELIVETASDLAERFLHIRRYEGRFGGKEPYVHPHVGTLLFLPLLRANVDLEEAWAPLIRHSESPLVREWLSRFPKEAATRRVEDLTRNKRGPSTNQMLGQTMSVIDLVPSEQLLTNIIEMANTLAKRRPKRRVACRDALREKCAAHPKVAASLDAAARALSAKERTFWLT